MLRFPTRFNKNLLIYTIIGLLVTPLISLALFQIFAGVLFILFVIDKYGCKLKSFDLFVYLITAFAVVRIISVIFSEYPELSNRVFHKEFLFYASFFALMYYLKVLKKKDLLKLIDFSIWAGVLVAVIGIIFFTSGKVDRAQSFGSGYSTFSTYLLIVLVFRLARKSKDELKKMLLWSLQTGLILSGIVLAMGRANITVAFLISIVMIFILKINYRAVIISVFVTAAVSLTAFQLNSEEINKRVEKPAALSDRDVLLEGFTEIYDEHPFLGFGPRTFHDVFPLKNELADKGIGSWHNEYIQTYIESGVIAFGILAALIVIFLIRAKKLLFDLDLSDDLKTIGTAAVFGIIVLLLAGLTGAFLYSPVLSVLFGFLLSLLSATYYIAEHPEGQSG